MVTDVFVEPVQLNLELIGTETDGTKDAETAGVGHRSGHVAAVGEGEDGELNPETFTKLVMHGETSCSMAD
jgi:hypothetical protein